MKKLIIILFCGLLSLSAPVSATQYEVDLGITPGAISLSKDKNNLLKGEEVKIYAAVRNYGEQDAYADVGFFMGATLLGEDGASVKAGGVADDSFIKFTVPESDFNVFIKVLNVDPEDQKSCQ